MIKISKFWNGLLMLAAGALVVSCADYNVTDDFRAEPDPSFVEPYKDLGPVKSYIDRDKFPNMSLGALLKVSDFNKQEIDGQLAKDWAYADAKKQAMLDNIRELRTIV